MLFITNPHLRRLEAFMQEVPNFPPKSVKIDFDKQIHSKTTSLINTSLEKLLVCCLHIRKKVDLKWTLRRKSPYYIYM